MDFSQGQKRVAYLIGVLTLISMLGQALVWAGDFRYITKDELTWQFQNQRLQELSSKLRVYKQKEIRGISTPDDQINQYIIEEEKADLIRQMEH